MMMGETRWALPFKIGFTPTIVQPTTFDAEVLKVGCFHPQRVFLIFKLCIVKHNKVIFVMRFDFVKP